MANSNSAKTTKKTGKANQSKVGPVLDVTKSRTVKKATRHMLWGKAAGRCEFEGCNRLLWKHPLTQEQVNIAEAAHIYAFSDKGPRGNEAIADEILNDLDNLMLACHDCHKTMDNSPGQYTVELMQGWKARHELRIETVTGIEPDKASHVVLYGANIGQHSSPLNLQDAAQALFPHRYPAERRPIELSTKNVAFNDADLSLWQAEKDYLVSAFNRRVKEQIEAGEINHLSVFGLAPQPLLILLGSLLQDICSADVYQRHREPVQTWDWPESSEPLQFEIERPSDFAGPPALVIEFTAAVTTDRITSALDNPTIWRIKVPNQTSDHIKSRQDLSNFRQLVHGLIGEIQEKHGHQTPLHIFPVAGVSVAIELGRIRQPKAHMPWIIYDQNNKSNGFKETITISSEGME